MSTPAPAPSALSPPPVPHTASTGWSPSRRALALLAMLMLVLAVPPPGAAWAEGTRWQWPVPAPHEVVARFEAPTTPYGPGHRGIDVQVAGGAQIRAVEAGTVRYRRTLAGRGVVSVTHADGLISTYEPVAGTVETGARVEAGDVLGTLEGSSPASHCGGGDCLHLGARRGETYLDPLLLLGGRGPSVLLPWAGDGARPGGAAPKGGAPQLAAAGGLAPPGGLAAAGAGAMPSAAAAAVVPSRSGAQAPVLMP